MFAKPGQAQTPTLGSAANFVLFTSVGAITNTGISQVTGKVGSNVGASTGFGNVNGKMETQNAATVACSTDVVLTYNQLVSATTTSTLSTSLGGDTLLAGVYATIGATTLNNTLTLNAQGNANAVFIFKIEGTFSALVNAKVRLMNGALACNVFWKTEGLTSFATGSTLQIELGAVFNAQTNQSIPLLNMVGGKLNIGLGTTLTLNAAVTTTAGVFSGSTSSNLIIAAQVGNLLFDQSVPGASNVLQVLTIGLGNDASFTLGNALNIHATGGIYFNAAGTKMITTTGQVLTLQSSALGTANIGNLNGATITGNVAIERYVANTAVRGRWRFLSSLVQGATSANWMTQFYVTGPGDGSDGFGDDPQDAPVDGGVALLLAAGAAYGYKRVKLRFAKNTTNGANERASCILKE